MVKIALVTDSIASIGKEDIEKYNIQVVPVNLLFKGKVYRDGIDLTTAKAYEFLEKNPEEFATSAPSAGDFLKAFRQAGLEADQIVCLTVSQKISATYDSARMAKDLFKAESPQKQIEVIDTSSAIVGQALLVLTTARLIEEEKNFNEIIKIIENFRKKIRVFLVLETIRHVYRTGRIPEIASKIGSILPFKPILKILEGKVHFEGVVSSKQRGIEKIINILKENLDFQHPEIGITHANTSKEAESLKEKIMSTIPDSKIFITECSPVVGYATGSGLLGIAFFSK